jgi:uncharacterized membrane protein
VGIAHPTSAVESLIQSMNLLQFAQARQIFIDQRSTGYKVWGLIAIILVIGLVFRFADLDWRALTNDETLTFLRISGYSKSELYEQVFNGQIITVEQLQSYQRPHPDRTLIDAMRAFIGHPEHPPLYYLMARFWMQFFDRFISNPVDSLNISLDISTVAALRGLSAFTSLLVFPCIYGVCLELFGSPLVGGVAIALVAVSPLHLFHAQSARQNSLWIVLIWLASWLLLRAMRLQTRRSWFFYAISLALGLYTHLFFGFTAIAHGLYLIGLESGRLSRIIIQHVRATLIGLFLFMPWIAVILLNWQDLPNRTLKEMPLGLLIQSWAVSLNDVFLNLGDLSASHPLIYGTAVLLFGLCCCALISLVQTAPKAIWLFVLTQIGVTLAVLILPDLLLGGQRSATGRYFIPAVQGIQLAIAYFLTRLITLTATPAQPSTRLPNQIGRWLFVLIISGGVFTHLLYQGGLFRAELLQTAEMVNQATQPLLISDADAGITILPLSYQLDSTVQLQLVKGDRAVPEIPDRFNEVFLFRPSDGLRMRLEQQGYQVQPIMLDAAIQDKLWRVQLP